MNENKSRSIKNFLYSALGQGITIAIGLILPRLFIVSYGSETNGLVNSVNQFVVYLSLFEAGLGTVSLQALYGPVAKQDRDAINSVLSVTHIQYKKTAYGYFAALIALALIYPLIADSSLSYLTVAGVVFFSGFGNVILFLCQGKYKLLLQAEGKHYITTNLSTIIVILTGVSKAILITAGFNVLYVLIVAFAINLIQAVYIYIYIKKKYRWIDLKAKPNYEAISEKNYMLVHQISGLIFHNTDILILTVLCDLKVVSVYSMYKLVITHLENILSTITGSVSFILGQSFNTDLEEYKKKIDFFESYYSAIAFALFTVAQSLFVPFMGLYTRGVEDINYQDYTLAVLFALIAIMTAMRTPMLFTINYAGHFKKTTPQSILESVINLVVSLAGVLAFGIYGVLFGTAVALFYRLNDIFIYANKKILGRSPLKTYMIYLVNGIIYVGLSVLFVFLMKDIQSYLGLVLYGVGYTAVSLVAFLGAQSLVFPGHLKTALALIARRRKT